MTTHHKNYQIQQANKTHKCGVGLAARFLAHTKQLKVVFVVQGAMLSVPPRFSVIVLVCSDPSACNYVFTYNCEHVCMAFPHFVGYLVF